MAGDIIEVTDNNFAAEVLESTEAVLVDFWAPWCGPCRIVAPHLEELNNERQDIRVVQRDVADNRLTPAPDGVTWIPTLILSKGGQEAKKIIGALPKKRLEQGLEPVLAWRFSTPIRSSRPSIVARSPSAPSVSSDVA